MNSDTDEVENASTGRRMQTGDAVYDRKQAGKPKGVRRQQKLLQRTEWKRRRERRIARAPREAHIHPTDRRIDEI